MFKATITNNFERIMGTRAARWASRKSISYTIMVPPELAWWYYQEYGVDHEYSIPTSPTGVAFTGKTGLVIRPSVIHPGLNPTHTVDIIAKADMNGPLQSIVRIAFEAGEFLPEAVDAVIKGYMDKLIEDIATQMEQDLRGRRYPDPNFPLQSGKLQGKSAAEVFRANAYVVKS